MLHSSGKHCVGSGTGFQCTVTRIVQCVGGVVCLGDDAKRRVELRAPIVGRAKGEEFELVSLLKDLLASESVRPSRSKRRIQPS